MAYREENGKRYENPHKQRIDSIGLAERSKEALTTQEDDTLAFIYTKEDPLKTMDPDKIRYAKSKPTAKDLNPETTGDNTIFNFSGEYKFLSPLHKSNVQLPGDLTRMYPSVEHALAASKTSDPTLKDAILGEDDPVAAKRIGSKALGGDKAAAAAWREQSLKVMGGLLRDKFKRGPAKYRERLLATGHRNLCYRVDHNDQFWGVTGESSAKAATGSTGKFAGSNHLGLLLMEVRAEVRKGCDMEAWLKSAFHLADSAQVAWSVSVTRSGKACVEDAVHESGESVLYCGKLSQCLVRTEHPTCSRLHAALVADSELGACAVDLGTANGTFVDGKRLAPFTAHPLTPTLSLTFAHSSRAYSVSVTTDAAARAKADLYSRLKVTEQQAQLLAQERIQASGGGGSAGGSGGGGSGGLGAGSVLLGRSGEQTDHTAFLANLPYSVTAESLLAWMAETNPSLKPESVSRVSVPMSKENPGEARGIAFVSFVSAGALLQAVALDGDLFGERTVKVKKAAPQSDDQKRAAKPKEGDYWKNKASGGGEGEQGKQGVCFDFRKGVCTRGAACRFAHTTEEASNENLASGGGGGGSGSGGGKVDGRRRDNSDYAGGGRRDKRAADGADDRHCRERSRSRERRRQHSPSPSPSPSRDKKGNHDNRRREAKASPGRRSRSRSPKRHRRTSP